MEGAAPVAQEPTTVVFDDVESDQALCSYASCVRSRPCDRQQERGVAVSAARAAVGRCWLAACRQECSTSW
eukprot:COSAG01_NODE_44090_length_422_cov_4.145511_1_plen_70_part_10